MTADWHQEMTGAHADLSKDVRAAWAKLLCCLAALIVLGMALPGPSDLASTVVDTVAGVGQGSDRAAAVGVGTPDAAAGFLNTTEHAVLLAAGLIVWVLLVWALAIVIIAGLGRLPGTGGRAARKALRRIAPAAAGRLVIAAVGVTAIAGAAGCAAPDGTGAPLVSVAPIAATSVAATTADPSTDSSTPPLDIDWPDPAAGSTQTPAPATGDSAAEPTSSAIPTDSPDQRSPQPGVDPAAPVSTAPPAVSPIGDPPAPTEIESAVNPSPGPTTTDQDSLPSSVPAPPSAPSITADPGAVPDPAVSPAPASSADATTPATGTAAQADASVTVRPGDTLWAIAACHLPSGATDAEIDTGWRAWYAANVDVIGGNPDLIIPGQHLLPGHSEMRP